MVAVGDKTTCDTCRVTPEELVVRFGRHVDAAEATALVGAGLLKPLVTPVGQNCWIRSV